LHDTSHLINNAWYPATDGYQELTSQDGVEFDIKELPHGHGVITIKPYQDHPSVLIATITIAWRGGLNIASSDMVLTLIVK
jgi:hypothetical protein